MIEQVREELLTTEGIELLLHPEGFVQVKGLPSGQLHVWHHDLPRYADADTLHDHVWDLQSYVLLGEQVNEVYAYRVNDGLGDWQLWGVVDLDELCSTQTGCVDAVASDRPGLGGTAIAPLGVNVYVTLARRERIPAGDEYTFGRRLFHRSRAEHGTATLIHKVNRLEGQQPLVAARVGQSPDRSPAAPEFDARFLWDAIAEVVLSC